MVGYLSMEIQEREQTGCCCGCSRARGFAGSKHGTWQKVSCPDSVFSRKSERQSSPESPERAVPAARHMGVLCLLVQLGAACSALRMAPAVTLRSAGISQNQFCTELNSVSVEIQLFKIYPRCHSKGHLHCCSLPLV